MRDQDRSAFATTIGAIAETFGRELTDAMLLGYWHGLCDIDLAQVQRGCYHALRESRTMPRPAELREFAGVQSPENQANLAWQDVLIATAMGPYKHLDFEDRLVNATIRTLGGWPTFLSRFSSAREEEFARLAFIKTYKSYANSGVNGEACLPLPGLSECECIDGMLCEPQPRRIRSAAKNASRLASPLPPTGNLVQELTSTIRIST